MRPLLCHIGLWLHARAEGTPYFHLDGYMRRDWILGARSPERNNDHPEWQYPNLVQSRAGVVYREICRRVAIRAHTIFRSDRDRHLHDHPSWSISLVLAGGYWEVFQPTPAALTCPLLYRAALDTLAQSWIAPENAADHKYLNDFGIYWRGPGSIIARRATCFHRLVLPRGVVAKSIFVMGKKTNQWGFLTSAGKIGWREYLGKPTATAPLNWPIVRPHAEHCVYKKDSI